MGIKKKKGRNVYNWHTVHCSQVNQQNRSYHCGPCVDFIPKSVFQTLGAVQELL